MKAKDAFAQFLKVRQSICTQTTLDIYRWMLVDFFKHIDPKTLVTEIDQGMIAGWIQKLREDGINPNTIRKKLGILGVFFGWCRNSDLLDVQSDPLVGVPVVRKADTQKVPFTWEQFQAVLTFAKANRTRRSYDWEHICTLAWHTGLRLSDCCCLQWSQVDFISDVIMARPKKLEFKRQELVIPMHPDLRAHLLTRYSARTNEEWVTPELRIVYLSRAYNIKKAFRALCDKLGYRQYSMHSFRHGFITRLLNAGASAEVVRQMTGQSLATLSTYAHISVDAKRAALEMADQPSQSKRITA